MNISKLKSIFAVLLVLVITTVAYFFFFKTENQPGNKSLVEKIINKEPEFKSDLVQNKVINILLIGKDIGRERKINGQTGFNTDILILLSINPSENRAILTSFPRDIWQNGGRINSILAGKGIESLLDAASKISGQKVDKYISIDFDGIRWLVDAFGGVNVEIKNTFTDSHFPNNTDTGIQTVSFKQGSEVMSGERALTFARSRKGDNGEGSDLMRAKRQHQILFGMTKAVENKNSQFFPFDIKGFYNQVILHTQTNVSLEDAIYLFSFYKNLQKYNLQSLVLDDRYIYHPEDATPFGGAWVFVAKDSNYQKLHTDLNKYLNEGVSLDNTQK